MRSFWKCNNGDFCSLNVLAIWTSTYVSSFLVVMSCDFMFLGNICLSLSLFTHFFAKFKHRFSLLDMYMYIINWGIIYWQPTAISDPFSQGSSLEVCSQGHYEYPSTKLGEMKIDCNFFSKFWWYIHYNHSHFFQVPPSKPVLIEQIFKIWISTKKSVLIYIETAKNAFR